MVIYLTFYNMKEHPILFSAPMVRAILAGRKTQTRRIMKRKFPHGEPEGGCTSLGLWPVHFPDGTWDNEWCPYGQPGTVLWVRETWGKMQDVDGGGILYRADFPEEDEFQLLKWKPSIHMPRTACRILLKITDIRVERLNDISERDSIAEGVESWIETRLKSQPTHYKIYHNEPGDESGYSSTAKCSYETLWQAINGPNSWNENPYVWAISFIRL